jgi:PAS domain-containing protein
VRLLVHELRVHQIELEMQNEKLSRSKNEVEISKARYIALFDQAPMSYLTISENGLILEANLTFAVLLLWPRRTLFTQPFSTFVAKEDQERGGRIPDSLTCFMRRMPATGSRVPDAWER